MSLPVIVHREKKNFREALFSKAFRVVPGAQYNRVSSELREQRSGASFQFYEIVMHEDWSWEYLKDEVYPSLARYLRYKLLDPRTGKGLIVSLFFQDEFHLIECPEFIKAFCEMEGLSEADFEVRIRKWLSSITPSN